LKSNKTLILVRHAHRDTDVGRERDNGLSDKGRAQAERVMRRLKKPLTGADVRIVSSPKRRCVQTVTPLARALGRRVYRLDDLDEGPPLGAKIKRFLEWFERTEASVVVVCSHGDWIPAAFGVDLKKGEWTRIKRF
jgi:broad specificity phosphatase PhoE